LLRRARHLHVASYFLQTGLQPGLPALFTRARSLSLTTSLDTNWDPSGQWLGVRELLPLTDVFLPNENEALSVSGVHTVGEALRTLGRRAGMVAVKCSASGALACRGEETAAVRPPDVTIVDTIGAGDSFDAGFICGFLGGWSLEKTLHLAVACGSLSTRLAGGTAAQPTLEEAMRHVPSAG